MVAFNEAIKVGDLEMTLYGNAPAGAGPFPGIVVIQHGPGVDRFVRTMVDRLAQQGYVAVAPDLYHRFPAEMEAATKRQQLKDVELIADVNATVEFLRRHRTIDRERLGITGFCMGGRVVYLMAAVNPAFKAAVAYYGGNIMVPWGDGVPAPVARSAEIRCPLMFHFGAEDTNPSPEDMRRLDAELSRHGKPHEFYTYGEAGHGFMDFSNPQRYREHAEQASWPRTLEFFARYLRVL